MLSTCVFGIPFLCGGALGAEASAATVTVNVRAHVKQNKGYAVKISGSFKRSELTGQAYLISLIQYKPAACKATAQLENSEVATQSLQFYFAPAKSPSKVGIIEKHSPFTRTDGFTAKALGSRRVCVYLYPRMITATSTVRPIATADKKFTVSK